MREESDYSEAESMEDEYEFPLIGKPLLTRMFATVAEPAQRTGYGTPERYAHINHDSSTPSGRRKFCNARDKVHEEARRQYQLDVKNGTYANLPATKCFVQCIHCGGGFVAKVADRKRGWARTCSKSCKAQRQNSR